jgi:hypothetical protein
MPSLSPGKPGAKEAYAICVLSEDNTIRIPPKAFSRYNLRDNELVLLTSTRKGECGFAIMNIDKAKESVFNKILEKINAIDTPVRINSRHYAVTMTKNGSITFNHDLLEAFELKTGERFIVIKSTSVAMSFNPVDIFTAKLRIHGFTEAISNIDKLEVLY